MQFKIGDKLRFIATGNTATVIGPGYTVQRWELRYSDGSSIYVDPTDADGVIEKIPDEEPPCIVCGAPIDATGAGHEDGCMVAS